MGKRKASSDSEDDDFAPEVTEISDDEDDEVMAGGNASGSDDDDFKEPPKKKAKTNKGEAKETKKKTPAKKKAKKDADEEESPKEKKKATKKAPAKKDAKEKKAPAKGGKAKKPTVDVIKSEPEAREVILEYLRVANRPYSIQNMLDNLHGRVKKAMCQKAIDKLVEKEEVTCKENGKAKVYFINQSNMEVMDTSELQELNGQIREVSAEVGDLKAEISTLNGEKTKLGKALSNKDLKKAIEALREEVEKKKARVEKLNEGTNLCTPQEKKDAQAKLDKYKKVWRERKQVAKEALDSILDMQEQKVDKEEFMDDIGFETDEQHGVNLNEMGQL